MLNWSDGTFDIPAGVWVIGDNAYNQNNSDDVLAEAGTCVLLVRKDNAKRHLPS